MLLNLLLFFTMICIYYIVPNRTFLSPTRFFASRVVNESRQYFFACTCKERFPKVLFSIIFLISTILQIFFYCTSNAIIIYYLLVYNSNDVSSQAQVFHFSLFYNISYHSYIYLKESLIKLHLQPALRFINLCTHYNSGMTVVGI